MILSVINCNYFARQLMWRVIFIFFAFFHLFFVVSLSSFVVLSMSVTFCSIDAAVDCLSLHGRFASSNSLICCKLISNNLTVRCFVEKRTIALPKTSKESPI